MATIQIAQLGVARYVPASSPTVKVQIAEVSMVHVADTPAYVQIASLGLTSSATAAAKIQISMVGVVSPARISPPAPVSVAGGAKVTLTAGAVGATEWEWAQASGPAVQFTASGSTATFNAPRNPQSSTVVMLVRAAVAGRWSEWASANVTVARHRMFQRKNSAWVPVKSGKPVTTPSATPTDGLFFELPQTTASTRKVLAHYFGPYPRSLNNAATVMTDTYTNAHNRPTYPDWAYKGGHYRNRPIYRPALGGDWKYQDCVFDLLTAASVGVDGFVCDLLGLSGSNYDNYMNLVRAAHTVNNGVKVIPMVDGNGATAAATPAQAADHIRKFEGYKSSWYLPDGRFVVMSYKGEAKSVDWWNQVGDELRTRWGIEPAFWLVFNNHDQSPPYASGLRGWIGSGVWGRGSDPAVINGLSNQVATARSRGELYCHPIQPQNLHLTASTPFYDEARNTAALRSGWAKAIREGADAVQLVTWSDYSEGGEYAPSEASGMVNLDLSAYYATRWKQGKFPEILRDALYLSHKSTLASTTYTATAQTTFLYQRSLSNRTPASNDVEVLSYLIAPAEVTVIIGGVSYSYDAPAGEYVWYGAAKAGDVSVEAVRDGVTVAEIESPVKIRSVHVTDNPGYFRFSSIRGSTGQLDSMTRFL